MGLYETSGISFLLNKHYALKRKSGQSFYFCSAAFVGKRLFYFKSPAEFYSDRHCTRQLPLVSKLGESTCKWHDVMSGQPDANTQWQ